MTVERDSLKTSLDAENSKVKVAVEKYSTDFQQFNFDAARSYGLGFEQALVQAKHFNPTADVSNCDPLKELVNNVLVDLGDGEEENFSTGGFNDEEVADLQGPDVIKPTEESNRVGNEEHVDAPAV
ncbi:F-box/kelch-repeat protein [Sesbania bispinosa]|nr:F-box/kelch-repeat protein [Sesbania bispinosa]